MYLVFLLSPSCVLFYYDIVCFVHLLLFSLKIISLVPSNLLHVTWILVAFKVELTVQITLSVICMSFVSLLICYLHVTGTLPVWSTICPQHQNKWLKQTHSIKIFQELEQFLVPSPSPFQGSLVNALVCPLNLTEVQCPVENTTLLSVEPQSARDGC